MPARVFRLFGTGRVASSSQVPPNLDATAGGPPASDDPASSLVFCQIHQTTGPSKPVIRLTLYALAITSSRSASTASQDAPR